MFTRFIQQMINSTTLWLESMNPANHPKPVPIKIRSQRNELQRRKRTR